MTKVEEYRVLAIRCDQASALAGDLETQAQFNEIARRWRELAKDLERAVN
jgi:hypothetical protein